MSELSHAEAQAVAGTFSLSPEELSSLRDVGAVLEAEAGKLVGRPLACFWRECLAELRRLEAEATSGVAA